MWRVRDLVFTGHGLRQMFGRGISTGDVRAVVDSGEVVVAYADDQPYPSRLLLGWVGDQPLHVVLAYDQATLTGYVVTAYRPAPALWAEDFKTRRAP